MLGLNKGQLVFLCGSSALVALSLLHYFPFVQVRENSMSPTLQPGSLLVLSQLSYKVTDVKVADMLVFSNGKGKLRIKRCVLAPPMPLQWQGKQLYIPYLGRYVPVRPSVYRQLAGLERVPDGSFFVLGDNVSQSEDSRSYGLVPLAQVRGKVLWF